MFQLARAGVRQASQEDCTWSGAVAVGAGGDALISIGAAVLSSGGPGNGGGGGRMPGGAGGEMGGCKVLLGG